MSNLTERNKSFLDGCHTAGTKELPNHRAALVLYADPKVNIVAVWDQGLDRAQRIMLLRALLSSEIQNQ